MGYVAGSSCFLHSPSSCPLLPSSSPPSHITSNTTTKFRTIPMSIASSSMQQHQHDDGIVALCNKRRFLLMGISVLPLLGLKAKAFEELGSTTKEREVQTPENDQKSEMATEKESPSPNPFLFFLNSFGIYSSATLGALYALARKEKVTALATIETMSSKLKNKEELIVSLKTNYESELLNERVERTKQLGKAKEEQQALVNKLSSANNTITRLEQEVKSQKKLIEELKLQIGILESRLSKADADKEELENNLKEKVDFIELLQQRINQLNLDLKVKEGQIQNLSSLLEEKELELSNLTSTYKQTKDDLSNAQFQIQRLKDELLKGGEELEAKDSLVNELNSRIRSLTLENDDSKRKYDAIEKEYNDLRLTAEQKAASDANLLRENEGEIFRLKDQLEHALSEARRNQVIIADLSQERENLKESLENESKKVINLKDELQNTKESLEKSRHEVSVLEKQLNESNKLQKELEFELSKLSSEFADVRESLQKSLDDTKHGTEMLTSELTSTKEDLKKTQAELQSISNELKTAIENRDSLQRELIDIYKKAETAAEELKEEKNLVASLSQDLQELEKQSSKDKEARKSLEKHLEEATESLDVITKNSVILSSELEKANSLISMLETEKETLNKSLLEQRNAYKEAQESIEYAQDLIKKLGNERQSLEHRGKKLVEELSVAKGEILQLRNRINSSKVAVNNVQVQKDEGESESKVTATLNKELQKDEVENMVSKNEVAVKNVHVQENEDQNESKEIKPTLNEEEEQKDTGKSKVSVNARKTTRRRKANPQ